MKVYDKIYLPERQEGARAFRDNQGDVPVAIHGNFIVLTIEELSEVFIAGQQYQSGIVPYSNIVPHSPDFKTFIQSKGINTDNNGK